MLKRLLQVKAEKGENGKQRFRITDESKDRHGTVIKMDGWDFSAFLNNPIMLYQHLSYTDNPDHALGYWDLSVTGDAAYAEPNYEPADLNPLADKVRRKVDFGTISMVSVGFNPSDWSFGNSERGEDPDTFYFRKQELLEVSIVHIGSNKNAHNKAQVNEQSIADFVKMAREERQLANKPETIKEETPESKGLDPILTDRYRSIRIMNTLQIS